MDDASMSVSGAADGVSVSEAADLTAAGIKVRDSSKDSASEATLNSPNLDTEWEMLAKDGWMGGKYNRRHTKRGRASKYDAEDGDDIDSTPTHRPHGSKHVGPPGPPGPAGPHGETLARLRGQHVSGGLSRLGG